MHVMSVGTLGLIFHFFMVSLKNVSVVKGTFSCWNVCTCVFVCMCVYVLVCVCMLCVYLCVYVHVWIS
jgi:hypothetical protein